MTTIHVGMPKTGTTAIQRVLTQNNLLANTNGEGKLTDWGRRAAGFDCIGPHHVPVTPFIDRLPQHGFVSDEDLVLADAEQARAIKRAVNATETVLVIRPFSELCESWWSEQVKHGETRTLVEWVTQVAVADPGVLPEARRVRADWVSSVWQPTIVFNYSVDVLHEFWYRTGLGLVPGNVPVWNTSLVPEATEALRRFNCRYGVSGEVRREIVKELRYEEGDYDRLLSDASQLQFMRYDEQMGNAIMDGAVASLSPCAVTVNALDESLVEAIYTGIEEMPCTASGNIIGSPHLMS